MVNIASKNSNNSQEFDSPFGQQRHMDSDGRIDIQNINRKDHINSPSLANQTANFFKNGENDNFSSREFNHSSPQIMSNNMIPDQTAMKNIIERQSNRTPTLSKPSHNINPTFSNDYILIGGSQVDQNIIGSSSGISNNGILMTTSYQFGKKLSEIDEEKEMGLLNNHIRRVNIKKSSIKVDNDSNNSQSENNYIQGNPPSRGNITTADQTSPQNAHSLSGASNKSYNNTNAKGGQQVQHIKIITQNGSENQTQNHQNKNGSSPNQKQNNNQYLQNGIMIMQNSFSQIQTDDNTQINLIGNNFQETTNNPNILIENNRINNENRSGSVNIYDNNCQYQNIDGNNHNNHNSNNNPNNIMKEDDKKQNKDQNVLVTKQSGSFRIKKNQNQKSFSVHTAANENQDKGISTKSGIMRKDTLNSQISNGIVNGMNNNSSHKNCGFMIGASHDGTTPDLKNNNEMKKPSIMEENNHRQQHFGFKQGFTQNNLKNNINLIEFVKNQQLVHKDIPRNSSQNIYNHFKQASQTKIQSGKFDSNGNLCSIPSHHEEIPIMPLNLKQTRKVSKVNLRGNNQNVAKFLSPKTNLIELVQQIQFKNQRANSISSQSLFQTQYPTNNYDQNMEIDGLSPISSNINPNFRGGYDYDAEDEEVAYQMDNTNTKSHNNIASMTNFQNLNNSSSYDEQRGMYSPYSKEVSQTNSVYPSIIQGWEFGDNSHIDFDNYEIEVQGDGGDGQPRLNNLQLSQRILQSQHLCSLQSQQNLVLPNSILNTTHNNPHQTSKMITSSKQLPSYSQIIGSTNSFKVQSPQLNGFQNLNLHRKSSNITPTHMQLTHQDSSQPTQIKKVVSELDSSPISYNSQAFKGLAQKGSDQDSISPKADIKNLRNYPYSSSSSGYQQQQQLNQKGISQEEYGQKMQGYNSQQQQQQSQQNYYKSAHVKNMSSPQSTQQFNYGQLPQVKQTQQTISQNYYVQDQRNTAQSNNTYNQPNPEKLRKLSSSSRRSEHSTIQNKADSKNNATNNTNESKNSINANNGGQTLNLNSDKKVGPARKSSDTRSSKGSPSKPISHHLSPLYANDMRFEIYNNIKNTMQIKETIRQLSDSSHSYKQNDSVLSSDKNQPSQNKQGQSQFAKNQQDKNGSNSQNGSNKSSNNNTSNILQQFQTEQQQQQQNDPKNKKNNNIISQNSDNKNNKFNHSNSNSSKKTNNESEINFENNNKQRQSLPTDQNSLLSRNVNLIELAKSTMANNQQRDQDKQYKLNVNQNTNLLNSLYNISEEPNELTEIQSRTNFDIPSSSHGRSLIFDQTIQGTKLNQNLMNSNLSAIQNQSENIANYKQDQIISNDQITNQNKALQKKQSSKDQVLQERSSIERTSINTINQTSQISIPSTSIKVIQNPSFSDIQQNQQKKQNLLDIINKKQNDHKHNSHTTPVLEYQTQSSLKPKVQVTQEMTIPESQNESPNKIQVISDVAQQVQSQLFIQSQPSNKLLESSILNQNPLVMNSGQSSKIDETTPKGRVQELQRTKKRENSQKKIQQIAQPTQVRQKSHYSNTPLHLSQQVPVKSNNNNLSVNSTILSSAAHPSQNQQSSSKRDKFQKLSKANTINISKTLSYSMLQEQHSVLETSKLDKSVNADGSKQINNYIILVNLGKGAFGKVKQVFDTTTKKHFAVKVINRDKLKKRKLDKSRSAFSLIEKEVAILKRMAHPNIVKLYEYIDDQDEAKIYLVMDLLKKGSINSKSYWKAEKGKEYKETEKYIIPEERLKKYFRDFLLGLDYLHNFANVVHRDIKPDNLLIGDEDQLKLADFGVSQMFEGGKDEISNDNGTKCYLAPEIFKNSENSGRPVDIWAAGVSFFEIFTRVRPFNGKNFNELKQSILETEPEYPSTMTPEFKAMLQKCLNKDPKKRATVSDLIVDDWVTDKGKNPLEFKEYEGDINDIKDEDIKNAITKSLLNKRVNITAKLKANLNKTRSNIEKKKSFAIDEDVNNNTLNVNNI